MDLPASLPRGGGRGPHPWRHPQFRAAGGCRTQVPRDRDDRLDAPRRDRAGPDAGHPRIPCLRAPARMALPEGCAACLLLARAPGERSGARGMGRAGRGGISCTVSRSGVIFKRPFESLRSVPMANLPEGEQPVLRIVPMPADTNAHGTIFGGWVMSQVDIA